MAMLWLSLLPRLVKVSRFLSSFQATHEIEIQFQLRVSIGSGLGDVKG